MIGDGHYLNTILELGPSLVATALRLEATLMRREMAGQPATPSSFINSDKMVSTLNAWPSPSSLSFSHSQGLSLQTANPCLEVSLYFCCSIYSSGSNPRLYYSASLLTLSFLISCLCLLSVCLPAWVIFVLANLLLVWRLTSVRQRKD